MKWC